MIKRLIRQKGAAIGALVLLICIAVAVLGPLIAPYSPSAQNLRERLVGPSTEHLAGTDRFGRDIFSRLIWGSRVSLQVGTYAVLLGLLLGIPLGLCAGYFGGIIDRIVGRVVDIMLSFPSLVLAIVVVGMVGTGILSVSFAIGITLIPRFARLIRAETLVTREEDFVMAARALAVPHPRILIVHVLPQALATVTIQASFSFANAIMSDAALAFLGLGVAPPTPTWGAMVRDGLPLVDTAWWVSTFPSIAIMLVVLSLNLLGDGLRDALDPVLHRGRGSDM